MTVKSKVAKQHLTEGDIDAVIAKGGSTVSKPEDRAVKFTLRIPESMVEKIDTHRKRRTGNVSCNTWILEAVEYFLAREDRTFGAIKQRP
jgi:hypothetical protein